LEEREAAVATEAPAAEGVYVYCIIESTEPQTFGGIGIGGRGDEIYTVHYRDQAPQRRSQVDVPGGAVPRIPGDRGRHGNPRRVVAQRSISVVERVERQ